MRFTPKTEEEIQSENLLPAGIYKFQVAIAENAISEKGNSMIKLSLSIWDSQGKIHSIDDYLLEAMARKLRHFCQANDLLEKYESGELHPSDCVNKEGKVELIIQAGKLKADGSGHYPSRNSVKDYIIDAAHVPADNASNKIKDDDIPF